MTPPPMHTSDFGCVCRARISRFVITKPEASPSFTPGIGGTAALEPVAITSRGAERTSPPAETVKFSPSLPRIFPSAEKTVTPCAFIAAPTPRTSVRTTPSFRATTFAWSNETFSAVTP